MTQTLLVIGAGAIGRGYLPWVFQDSGYEFVFVDNNPDIISRMRKAKCFTTYRVRSDVLESCTVRVAGAFSSAEFDLAAHPGIVAGFFSVGPRQVEHAAAVVRGSSFPLILCENDPGAVDRVKAVVGHDHVLFAVPDVITSNTAPAHILETDPLAVVSEDGTLFIEAGAGTIAGNFSFLERDRLIGEQWRRSSTCTIRRIALPPISELRLARLMCMKR